VTQALDRVRKAAKLRKKEQFTALLHHINVDLLRTAFYALKRRAAPGVDGVTWEDYEADLEPRLADLHTRPTRRISPATLPPNVHTEGGRDAAAVSHRRPGRENRPGRNRYGAQRHLRK
jgi:hypothetical protein